jgi:glycosidase
MVAIMLYIDLFAGDLRGLKAHVPYLGELGINYVHMLPFFKTREGADDGGYAVSDFRQIESRFGTMADFAALVAEFRHYGINCCVDFILNHTAKEHAWAVQAAAGDPFYQSLYLMYETSEIPDQFEQTVAEVLPLVSPKNFTYYESFQRWVFTSFNEYQWDLNYQNPVLFNLIIEELLLLANTGVAIIRLDAVPFMWKDLGTSCRNRPMVHTLMKLMQLIMKVVCPSVVLKGEAIVEPIEIVRYFGSDEQPECKIMYNASNMVLLWNSLATRDTRMMTRTLQRSPKIPQSAVWINYVRCHDDIGWGFDHEICCELGFDPEQHKQFLIRFFQGDFPGSFSTGELYEFNPVTLDARISGSTASLCGCEQALQSGDPVALEHAIRRILLIHAMILAEPGIPMIYSGDEIGMLNDWTYKQVPEKQMDTRWLHRPAFDWTMAESRRIPTTYAGRIFLQLSQMIRIRKSHDLFDAQYPAIYIETENPHVFTWIKCRDEEALFVLANFKETEQTVHVEKILRESGLAKLTADAIEDGLTDLLTDRVIHVTQNPIQLQPYECLWLYRKVPD